MRSMTGYGRGEAVGATGTVTVEIRTVNQRFLELNLRLPRTYMYLEDTVRNHITACIARGRVEVFADFPEAAGTVPHICVHKEPDLEFSCQLSVFHVTLIFTLSRG